MGKVKTKGSGQIFDNKILEALTRTHPALIVGMYVPLCLLSMWYHYTEYSQNVWVTVGLAVAAFLGWTLVEYILHRYVFHFVNENPTVQRVHYMIHGVHHDYPNDKERLIMPPVPSLIIAALFFGVFYLFFGWAVFALLPGFILGYLSYALMHYSIHAFKPPFPWLKNVWRHHHLHHHKYPDKAYGVSSPFWDHIFGTVPPQQSRK